MKKLIALIVIGLVAAAWYFKREEVAELAQKGKDAVL